jgi:lysophospholipase L1-like esterase
MLRIIHTFAFLTVFVLAGCATERSPSHNGRFQSGESVVLIGNEPAHVAFAPTPRYPVSVRSTYLDNLTNTVHYLAGRDYIFDYTAGTIQRMPGSRIPDFSTNLLFGKEDFDHSKFPGYGNGPFLVFIDYVAKRKPRWPVQSSQVALLPRTLAKLKAGQKITLFAFGDSITAGGEATRPELIYWQRWTDALKQKYPRAEIQTINGATGGDTTANGLARLEEKVLKRQPDLVLIAFGMNDHNIPGFGVPLETFSQNLRTMIDCVREHTSAEIILISAFPPNLKWHFGSHRMEQYAKATEAVAREKKCAYADVYHNWVAIAAAKKPEDLLGNNINHPNDFGHGIYFQVLQQVGL